MALEDSFEVTKIYSISEGITTQQGVPPLIFERPFREIHHTASKIAITGGGFPLKPGEITLAHKGVLFMDEITEFPRNVLETLRQPLEDGFINISRAKSSTRFPCDFTLLAAMNNCPCGRLGSKKRCKCTPKQVAKYQNRLSGPILDRFDIFIETPSISIQNFLNSSPEAEKEEEKLKERITLARALQRERYSNIPEKENARISADTIKKLCQLKPKAKAILDKAATKLDLSNRGYLKIIKVARTIADLDQRSSITEDDILEAIQYRSKIPN